MRIKIFGRVLYQSKDYIPMPSEQIQILGEELCKNIREVGEAYRKQMSERFSKRMDQDLIKIQMRTSNK